MVDIITKSPVKKKEEVFLDFYLGDTPEEAEATFRNFSKLLNIMSNGYSMWSGIDKEDLFGTALVGLARAKRDFNPVRSDNFKTFAIYKIKNALNDYYRENKTIVSIPSYVKTAHGYINNIKFLLGKYYLTNPIDIVHAGEIEDKNITSNDIIECNKFFKKLKRLSKNVNIPYQKIIDRSEYIPTAISFEDEETSQEEVFNRERQLIDAALLVDKLKDDMTEIELSIAEGIMSGKTYKEIGNTQQPQRSAPWVKQRLDKMRSRFRDKLKEGL
jgi:RNA polymerase sigma factor (sigma-70 family)